MISINKKVKMSFFYLYFYKVSKKEKMLGLLGVMLLLSGFAPRKAYQYRDLQN